MCWWWWWYNWLSIWQEQYLRSSLGSAGWSTFLPLKSTNKSLSWCNYKVKFSIPNVNCHCWYLWDMKLEAFLHPLFNIHGLKLVICLSCCDKWAGIYDDGGSFNIWHSSWAHHSLELSTLTTIRESPFPVSGTQLAQALPVGAWLGSWCMVHCSMWAQF